MKRRFVKSTEDRLLVGFLGFLFLFSLAAAVFGSVTGRNLPISWNTPVVLAALYAILRLVGPVPQIRSDVRYLREVANVRVQRMPNVKDFYDSLNDAVESATSTLDLTHIRDTPPEDFGEHATKFYSQLLDWCAVEGRSVRRIICIRSPAMHEWARQLADETKHRSRFKVRVINWAIPAPAMNMAIVDNKVVYLALTGSTPERTKGLGIEDEAGSQYFSDYYENLWHSSTDIDEWLAGNSWEGGREPDSH